MNAIVSALAWDDMKDDDRARALARAKRLGARLTPHPAWAALLREARSLGWPVAFAADLYIHDARALANAPPDRPFLWAIGETGTFLTWREPRGSAHGIVRHLETDRPRMFTWDGARWRAVDAEEARRFLSGEP